MIPAGTIIFAAPSDDDMIAEARTYIKRMALTKDDVKLAVVDGCVIVRLKGSLSYE